MASLNGFKVGVSNCIIIMMSSWCTLNTTSLSAERPNCGPSLIRKKIEFYTTHYKVVRGILKHFVCPSIELCTKQFMKTLGCRLTSFWVMLNTIWNCALVIPNFQIKLGWAILLLLNNSHCIQCWTFLWFPFGIGQYFTTFARKLLFFSKR